MSEPAYRRAGWIRGLIVQLRALGHHGRRGGGHGWACDGSTRLGRASMAPGAERLHCHAQPSCLSVRSHKGLHTSPDPWLATSHPAAVRPTAASLLWWLQREERASLLRSGEEIELRGFSDSGTERKRRLPAVILADVWAPGSGHSVPDPAGTQSRTEGRPRTNPDRATPSKRL